MTKDDIQLLYEYDRWANARILTAASALSMEQFTQDLGGSFRSVRDTLVHILSGQWIWLEYWKASSHTPGWEADLRARRDSLFQPKAFHSVDALRQKWSEFEADLIQFVSGLTDESLQQMLPVRATHIKLMHLLQHLANHSTYHRGQVVLMMRQLGVDPVATDFHVFLAEGPRSSVSAD